MTGTDIREALHAVAENTPAPAVDRIALQAQVRRERRHRLGERPASVLLWPPQWRSSPP